jgi:hypothetical protein
MRLGLEQQIYRYQQYANTNDKYVIYDAPTTVTMYTNVYSD